MGINLLWVCHEHRKYHYSMRGQEGIDFQAMIRTPEEHRGCPAQCFRQGNIRVYLDSHFDPTGYEEWWPVWEERPAELRKMKASSPPPPQYEVRDRYDVAWYLERKDERG